jgi:hypothetical protein
MNNDFHYIHPKFFIGIFFICPFFLLIALVDVFVFEGAALRLLPSRPEEWSFWLVIFSLPHIISSFITMADTENIGLYKNKIGKAFIVLGILSILFNGVIPVTLNNSQIYNFHVILFLVYGFFTINHVTTQQLGIGLILSQQAPNSNYQIFKWLCISLTFLLFVLVVFRGGANDKDSLLTIYGYYFAGILLTICCYFGYKLSSKAKNRQGKLYIYLNLLMFGTILIFAILDYSIFALMVPRIIHDVTAFVIYSNHDANKFLVKKNHLIYTRLTKFPISILAISPMLGILIAFVINNIHPWLALYSLLIFDFLHYYIESFIWKKEGTHRSHLKITNN